MSIGLHDRTLQNVVLAVTRVGFAREIVQATPTKFDSYLNVIRTLGTMTVSIMTLGKITVSIKIQARPNDNQYNDTRQKGN